MSRRFVPWQVWWTDFDPQVGREQAGRRPAIIVGTPLACTLPNGLVIVVPTTTRDRGLPFQPPVKLSERTSYAMTDQVKSISVERLASKHPGALTPDEVEAVKFSLRRIIDC